MVRTVVREKFGACREFTLDPECPVMIGREESCAVRIPDTGVSRKHARLFHADDTWWLEDLESANGTFHRGRKIHRAALDIGDTFKIDMFEFRFDRVSVEDPHPDENGALRGIALPEPSADDTEPREIGETAPDRTPDQSPVRPSVIHLLQQPALAEESGSRSSTNQEDPGVPARRPGSGEVHDGVVLSASTVKDPDLGPMDQTPPSTQQSGVELQVSHPGTAPASENSAQESKNPTTRSTKTPESLPPSDMSGTSAVDGQSGKSPESEVHADRDRAPEPPSDDAAIRTEPFLAERHAASGAGDEEDMAYFEVGDIRQTKPTPPPRPPDNSFEVRRPDGTPEVYAGTGDVAKAIVNGRIGHHDEARHWKPSGGTNKEATEPDWTAMENLATRFDELRILYTPLWFHTMKGCLFGFLAVTAFKALDSTVLFFSVNPLAGILWLLAVGSIFFPKYLWWAFPVVIIATFKFGGGANFYMAFFSVMIIGAVIGCPGGMAVGTIVGFFRLRRLPRAPDAAPEGIKPLVFGLIVPGILCTGFTLLYLLVVIPWLAQWLAKGG